LSPKELFAAWLVQHSTRNRIETEVEAGRMSRGRADRFLAQLGGEFSYMPLGVVPDGERVAHIVYRSEPAPEAWPILDAELEKSQLPPDEREFRRDLFYREHPGFLTCHRTSHGPWRVLASRNFFGVGGGLWSFGDENTTQEETN
jgi:hypothetical protein